MYRQLLKSDLNECKQYVYFNGFLLNVYIPKCGVPQGSNLGPILLLIFIHYLLQVTNSCILENVFVNLEPLGTPVLKICS